MSFLFLGLLAIHIALGALIAVVLIRLARRYGRTGWKYSVPIVVASYLMVFWDVIPTAVVHDYLCRTQAGVTIFKNADTWSLENDNSRHAVAPFIGNSQFRINEDRLGYWLNNRFYIEHVSRMVAILPVFINIESINDGDNGELLVERRWISSGYQPQRYGGISISSLKGWVGVSDCVSGLSEFTHQNQLYRTINGDRK